MTYLKSEAPPGDWIAAHRAVWARKPGLRSVYERWFTALRDATEPPRVELGCGPGFFKERHPEIIASDAIRNPYADLLAEAASLPFADASVGGLVLVDVFHHLPRPAAFLADAARVLRPGGRVAMIEPWIGLAGRLFYRHVHHEELDLTVDPARPWADPAKAAMEGNAALPYLFFREGGHLDRLGLPLRLVRREPFAGLPWLLSGGFQSFGLLPTGFTPTAERLDRLLSALPWLTAVRCLVVVERTPGGGPATAT